MTLQSFQATYRKAMPDGQEPMVLTTFFTGRGPKTNEKAKRDCDTWLASKMREHGSHNVDCTISQVLMHIQG